MNIKNNYSSYKSAFKNDTGIDPKDNPELYMEYYKARLLDTSMQMLNDIAQQIQKLPKENRLQIAEMIRGHETIKEFLKKS